MMGLSPTGGNPIIRSGAIQVLLCIPPWKWTEERPTLYARTVIEIIGSRPGKAPMLRKQSRTTHDYANAGDDAQNTGICGKEHGGDGAKNAGDQQNPEHKF